MEMSNDQIKKEAMATIVQTGFGLLAGKVILSIAKDHGWKRTTRYYAWSTKPKTVIVWGIIGMGMNIALREIQAREEAGRQLDVRIQDLEMARKLAGLD